MKTKPKAKRKAPAVKAKRPAVKKAVSGAKIATAIIRKHTRKKPSDNPPLPNKSDTPTVELDLQAFGKSSTDLAFKSADMFDSIRLIARGAATLPHEFLELELDQPKTLIVVARGKGIESLKKALKAANDELDKALGF